MCKKVSVWWFEKACPSKTYIGTPDKDVEKNKEINLYLNPVALILQKVWKFLCFKHIYYYNSR